jgi:hypothetical protein
LRAERTLRCSINHLSQEGYVKKSLCGVFAVLSLLIASCATSVEEPSGTTSADEAAAVRADEAAASSEAIASEPQGCGAPAFYCSRVQGSACSPEGGARTCVDPGTCEFPWCYCTDGTWQCEF